MLRAALGFFVVGLLAYILGAYNFAGLSIELGRILLTVFLVLAALSIIGGLLFGRSPKLLR